MNDTLLLDGISDEGQEVAAFCGESILDVDLASGKASMASGMSELGSGPAKPR